MNVAGPTANEMSRTAGTEARPPAVVNVLLTLSNRMAG